MKENKVSSAPTFHVIGGTAVKNTIDANKQQIFDAVETGYRLHGSGDSVNPDSYFLRYPDRPSDRIIALPAHLGGDINKSGIKWISSFPGNTADNLARASAVLILNDAETGYPIACLEASLISATRTAVSAALAAEQLTPEPFGGSLGVVGTGVIAKATIEWLLFRNWKFSKINLYDLNRHEAEHFKKWLSGEHQIEVVIQDRLEDAITDSSLVLFTTTALEPYLTDEKIFEHCPTVLHLSLRDLSVNVILASQNFVDDIDHCLKAKTSPHLAEMSTGNRDFISGTLVDVVEKRVSPDKNRARIFSPFGLGVLDIAVGNFIFEAAVSSGQSLAMPDFFSNSSRW